VRGPGKQSQEAHKRPAGPWSVNGPNRLKRRSEIIELKHLFVTAITAPTAALS
jgi:hypothetical protein